MGRRRPSWPRSRESVAALAVQPHVACWSLPLRLGGQRLRIRFPEAGKPAVQRPTAQAFGPSSFLASVVDTGDVTQWAVSICPSRTGSSGAGLQVFLQKKKKKKKKKSTLVDTTA